MKRNYICFTCLLFLFTCCKEKQDDWTPDARAMLAITHNQNKEYHFEMGNGLLEALVSAEHGGKLASLKYKGQQILVTKDIDSLAYGSTFWPSPHNWGWPPASGIDRDAYASTVEGGTLIMQGPVIEGMGLRFIKHFSIGVKDTTLNFTYLIVNESDEPKSIAPWEVTRVPKGGFTFFPVKQEYPAFEAVPSGNHENLYYCSVANTYSGRSQKINFDGTQGWLAHAVDGVLLIKKFRDLSANEIAPKEGDVEIYIDDDTNYMELENQGAYVALMPGDTTSYKTCWYLTGCTQSPSLNHIKKLESIVKDILERNEYTTN